MTGNHDVWKGREAARIAASEQYNDGMLDISEPIAPVEVELSADGTRLWVNIGGRCVLRVSRIATKTVVRGAGRL